MLDLELVDKTIEELENDETTVFNCQVLAALYAIQDRHARQPKQSHDNVTKELCDIFPEYAKYKETKLKYQQNEESKVVLVNTMHELCDEIQQFVQTLYCSSELPEEREQIRSVIFNLKGLF